MKITTWIRSRRADRTIHRTTYGGHLYGRPAHSRGVRLVGHGR